MEEFVKRAWAELEIIQGLLEMGCMVGANGLEIRIPGLELNDKIAARPEG